MDEEYYTTNTIAKMIKKFAIIYAVVGIIVLVFLIFTNVEQTILGIIGLILLFVSTVFIYAIGEGIEIIHDVRTNTEHIRDYLENKEKKK